MGPAALPHPWVSTWDAMGDIFPYKSKAGRDKCPTGPRSRRAPVNDLPTEILQAIFLLAYPAVYVGQVNILSADTEATESPWKLELVCSRWCLVSQSYHALWSTIDVEATRGSSRYGTKPILKMQLELCLERSGTRPLTIRVGDKSNAYSRAIRTILEIVGQHSERWRSIELHFPLSNLAVEQVEQIKGRLPLLRAVKVQVGREHSMDVADGHCRALFLQSPTLTQVSLCNLLDFHQALDLPWQQIRELTLKHIEGIHPAQLWGRLTDISANLTKLTLSNISFAPYSPFPPTGTAVKLDQLRELSIVNCAQHCGRILADLVCPSLTSLTIEDHQMLLTAQPQTFQTFVTRSECPIRHLTLKGVHPTAFNYLASKLDTVTHLEIVVNSMQALEILEMVGGGTRGKMLPGLESLCLAFQTPITSGGGLNYQIHALKKALGVVSPRHLEVGFMVKQTDVKELWDQAYLGGLQTFCMSRKMTAEIYQISAEEERKAQLMSVNDLRARLSGVQI
ncbi:unnamed protein product [Cyclocybe aegerita]|uniref:F-box domain-containing protein n=1 Tax=Cyclocybe aegerita TaxID=1973307 RepID=A0A8S0VR73_CYCAE|nr:unnamed protein product [Cyclocybe aegerita]